MVPILKEKRLKPFCMNITIKASNTTLTDGIKQAVEDKISVLEPFLKSEDKIHVEIEVDPKHNSGDIFRAEIGIQPHGEFADAKAADMYEAIDMVIPKIREQLSRKKDKKISLRRRLGNFFKRQNS